MTGRSILCLPEIVAGLADADQALFERLFAISFEEARLVLPPSMRDWVEDVFGRLDAVEAQRVVRVANRATYEEALFNTLRALRPLDVSGDSYGGEDLASLLESGRGDPFCQPLEATPEDVFGRVRGQHCVTASNIAKIDAFHGVIVFDEHNPLRFTREQVADYLRTGVAWGERVLATDPSARYWFFWWNALWKSGASILHGHAQVLCGRHRHYTRVERFRRAAERYRHEHGGSYFPDLVRAHEAVGLTLRHGSATLLASLAPTKEREVWIVDDDLTESLLDLTYRVLDRFVNELGVQSFNVAYIRPPLGPPDPLWADVPHTVRILDRGALTTPMADMGGLELFASTSIASDPYEVLAALAP